MENIDREYAWDDEIEKDSDFYLLPEGDYDFTVESFERGRHNGSEKLPPCPKAILKIRIETDEGTAVIKHNLFLHSKVEGLLSAFFTSIGQKKKDERIRMNWAEVPGSTGRCKVGIHTWSGNDGTERKNNQILQFYPKEKEQKKWEAGKF